MFMRTMYLALGLIAASAASAHAFSCKPNQGVETKVDFAIDDKNNPVMPKKYHYESDLRTVYQVCVDGPTTVTFDAVPGAKFRSAGDVAEAVRLVVELSKLGLTAEAAPKLMEHVAAEMKKVTPEAPKVADGKPAGAAHKK